MPSDAPRAGAAVLEVCANCGRRLDRGEWHPTAQVEREGLRHVVSFCSETCREGFTGR